MGNIAKEFIKHEGDISVVENKKAKNVVKTSNQWGSPNNVIEIMSHDNKAKASAKPKIYTKETVHQPSDREVKMKSKPIGDIFIGTPITWNQFEVLSYDTKKEYLDDIFNKFPHLSWNRLKNMFGASEKKLYPELERLGYIRHKYNALAKEDGLRFEKDFLHMRDNSLILNLTHYYFWDEFVNASIDDQILYLTNIIEQFPNVSVSTMVRFFDAGHERVAKRSVARCTLGYNTVKSHFDKLGMLIHFSKSRGRNTYIDEVKLFACFKLTTEHVPMKPRTPKEDKVVEEAPVLEIDTTAKKEIDVKSKDMEVIGVSVSIDCTSMEAAKDLLKVLSKYHKTGVKNISLVAKYYEEEGSNEN